MRAISIVHRSDTLKILISVYKNHLILDNTGFNRNNYISDNIDSSWLSPISIESMGETCPP